MVLNDPRATLHAVRVAREVGPQSVIIARARYVGETAALLAAGADEVVAQELEASFTIIERVTREARLPRPRPGWRPAAVRRGATPGRARGRERRGAGRRVDCRPQP